MVWAAKARESKPPLTSTHVCQRDGILSLFPSLLLMSFCNVSLCISLSPFLSHLSPHWFLILLSLPLFSSVFLLSFTVIFLCHTSLSSSSLPSLTPMYISISHLSLPLIFFFLSLIFLPFSLSYLSDTSPSLSLSLSRGVTASNGAGFGIERPAELTKADDEYDAFRKRMMLAYRFRPNPLVRPVS